jgi:hypothetical protein
MQFADDLIVANQGIDNITADMQGIGEYDKKMKFCPDKRIPFEKRKKICDKYAEFYAGTDFEFRCPSNLYINSKTSVNSSKWGGIGGCGFNIWDVNGKKYWIDIDKYYNIISGIKEGPDAEQKNIILMKIPEHNRTIDCLTKIFTDGFKTSESSELIKEGDAIPLSAGRKTKKSRKGKTKKSRKGKSKKSRK